VAVIVSVAGGAGRVLRVIVGLRPGTDQEREGLDLVDHGERAYNY